MSVSRRGFLVGGAAASFTVGAFDPVSRLWLSTAHAHSGAHIPTLDGQLTFDPAAIAEAGGDFGHLVEQSPWAVLEAGSYRDVVRMVRFAKHHCLKIATRGQGHSVYGQAQVSGGIVVDSRTLNTIHTITSDHAWVDAGVKWEDLLNATLAQGVAPPVLTDYLGLSVGGVLSVGGMGGASNRSGMVTDSVEELLVVTGNGRRVRCSPHRRRRLFYSVLGGLGQYALILKAKIKLVPQAPFARIFELSYGSLGDYLADQRTLAADERFDFLQGQIAANPAGGWIFVIQAGAWFDPAGTLPDNATLTTGLNTPVGGTTITDLPFVVWSNRVEQLEAAFKPIGLWDTPHPWSDIFMPDASIEAYITQVLSTLTPADVGAGLQLLYPFKKSNLRRSFVQVPNDPLLWLYDILRFPSDVPTAEQQVLDNRVLLDDAIAVGGKRYPISAVESDPHHWVQHYGGNWYNVIRSKVRFDRWNTLTPGQGIFTY